MIRPDDNDLGSGAADHPPYHIRQEEHAHRWRSEALTALLLAIILFGLLSLAGCASDPAPPSGSLESIKREARQQHYRACLTAARREYSEEIMAGFYTMADISDACRRWARRRVR